MNDLKEQRYKKTIRELQARLNLLETTWEGMDYTIKRYQKAFAWLNKQDWFRENRNTLTDFVRKRMKDHRDNLYL